MVADSMMKGGYCIIKAYETVCKVWCLEKGMLMPLKDILSKIRQIAAPLFVAEQE